jgi:transposase
MFKISEEDRVEVESFLRRGKANARSIRRGQVLLKSGEGWRIKDIAETFGVSEATVSNVRKRYEEGGVAGVMEDKRQAKRRQALDGVGEAVLVALACSPVPEGHDHWTLRMLRDKLIELEVVEGISAATVQIRLKKMSLSPGSGNTGVSPKR